jgi:hypothetical protein
MRGISLQALTFAIAFGAAGHAQQSDGGANSSTTAESGSAALMTTKATVTINSLTSTLGNGTCPSRTANYITHTLPQQCLRKDRTTSNVISPSESISTITGDITGSTGSTSGSADVLPSTLSSSGAASVTSLGTIDASSVSLESVLSSATNSEPSQSRAESSVASESETDSPLDNAKFLSFEEWKKQNIVKTPEPSRDTREAPDRPRPINNALDGFGDEGEIELDFSGFGSPASGPRQQQAAYRSTEDGAISQVTPATHSPRSKDAGKTCKERTNYASFDCAATVLKNNPECKSSSSVLVESKDSYMLNTCSAKNKFIIIELCNDILVDTIVLANYEFFSSIFRHFRVSVSDVYPVPLDKWKELGTFEAQNSRDVQAFLIEHPQIWARYLRVEFLTHYGSEFYCPVSLLRVHGTTMLEDMRHQEIVAQTEISEDVITEPEVTNVPSEPQEPDSATVAISKETLQMLPAVDKDHASTASIEQPMSEKTRAVSMSSDPSSSGEAASTTMASSPAAVNLAPPETVLEASAASDMICSSPSSPEPTDLTKSTGSSEAPGPTSEDQHDPLQLTDPLHTSTHDSRTLRNATVLDVSAPTHKATDIEQPALKVGERNATLPNNGSEASRSDPASNIISTTNTADIANGSNTVSSSAATTNGSVTAASTNSTSRVPPSTASAPPQPQPSTQESFFKSIHKRLQQLEANSTLSLQYIEEQSRILRDAFSKVEKRQISATTTFLTNLNQTVMQELHGFRQAYDQLWQSTVIELEGQREQYQREMLAMSSRLTLVADELVWQKRMGIVQSTLLLLCLGLVLFSRSGTTGYLEVPLMQQMMNKSSAALGRGGWESPLISHSPESRSPVSQFRRRLWRSVTDPSAGENATDGMVSGTDSRPCTKDGPALNTMAMDMNVLPPTPPNGVVANGSEGWEDADADDEEDDVLDPRESKSGPATPRGTRGSESASDGFLDAG